MVAIRGSTVYVHRMSHTCVLCIRDSLLDLFDLISFRDNRELNRVLSWIYRLGEKSRVAEGHELPRGVRVHAPLESF